MKLKTQDKKMAHAHPHLISAKEQVEANSRKRAALVAEKKKKWMHMGPRGSRFCKREAMSNLQGIVPSKIHQTVF